MTDDEKLVEKKVKSTEIYDGKLLHVFSDEVELPNGRHSSREYIKHNGAVGIVPLTENGEVIYVKQYRYPIDKVTVEIPAGKIDPGEEKFAAAQRELKEETGLTAGKWTYLGSLFPSVAYTTEVIHLYLAQDLKSGKQRLDEDEFLNVYKMKLSEFTDKVMNNEICDSKTEIAILKTAKLTGNEK